MSEIQYSPDKPKDCKYCYWYEKRKGCTFGEHCYYEGQPEPKRSPCDGCSYIFPGSHSVKQALHRTKSEFFFVLRRKGACAVPHE